uniref:SAM domain-containing protein n=1 Tax=Panagrolaimus superbus TaxID=310955 RepID=A0A914YKA1_9BILA
MSSPLALWTKFFRSCNLPTPVCEKYASNFVRERIQPAMLNDLSKSELRELGIETVGDQLAVLRRIKESDGVPAELAEESRSSSSRNTRNDDSRDIREIRRGRPAPDRNEIYHVTMPEGRNPRTRAILERHSELRETGRISRGTTGVRVGGVSVNRVSNESRVIKKPTSRMRSDIIAAGLDDDSPRRVSGRGFDDRRMPLARPLNNAGANRFAHAVGVARDPIRVSAPVRVSRPAAYDEDMDDYDNGPVRVVRRVRYV